MNLLFVANDKQLMFFPERSFIFRNSGEFIVTQDPRFIGGFTWDAEVVLAHYLDEVFYARFSTFPAWNTLKILELGCGCGLSALVCARLGARIVTASDKPEIIHLVEQCSQQNHVVIHSKPFIWGKHDATDRSDWESYGCPFDVIIAADILYHEDDYSDLKASLDYLTRSGTIVLIAYEERRRDLNIAWRTFECDYDVLDLSDQHELCRYYKDSIQVGIHSLTKR